MVLILGIDDAGRGPLIGPMVLAGVLIDKNSETALKNFNIKDSKQIIHSTRIKLAKTIKELVLSYHIVKTSPEEIDRAIYSKLNLNTLEAIKSAEIINQLNNKKPIKVIIDCPSVNTKKWKETLLNYIENPENLDIHCEHKADENYLSVGAASILAKVEREEEVAKLKQEYGDIGSGYPSDPDTKQFGKFGNFQKIMANLEKAISGSSPRHFR